jgi:hypothetical protein
VFSGPNMVCSTNCDQNLRVSVLDQAPVPTFFQSNVVLPLSNRTFGVNFTARMHFCTTERKREPCVGLQFRHPSSNYLTPFYPNKVLKNDGSGELVGREEINHYYRRFCMQVCPGESEKHNALSVWKHSICVSNYYFIHSP